MSKGFALLLCCRCADLCALLVAASKCCFGVLVVELGFFYFSDCLDFYLVESAVNCLLKKVFFPGCLLTLARFRFLHLPLTWDIEKLRAVVVLCRGHLPGMWLYVCPVGLA